jgi:hypothetical protein
MEGTKPRRTCMAKAKIIFSPRSDANRHLVWSAGTCLLFLARTLTSFVLFCVDVGVHTYPPPHMCSRSACRSKRPIPNWCEQCKRAGFTLQCTHTLHHQIRGFDSRSPASMVRLPGHQCVFCLLASPLQRTCNTAGGDGRRLILESLSELVDVKQCPHWYKIVHLPPIARLVAHRLSLARFSLNRQSARYTNDVVQFA